MMLSTSTLFGHLTSAQHGDGLFASGSPGAGLLRLNGSAESSRYIALFSPTIVLAVAGLIFCAFAWLLRQGKLGPNSLLVQLRPQHLMVGLLLGVAVLLTLWNPA